MHGLRSATLCGSCFFVSVEFFLRFVFISNGVEAFLLLQYGIGRQCGLRLRARVPLPSNVVSPLPNALDTQNFPISQDPRVPHVTAPRPLQPLPPPRFFHDTRGARGARGLLLQFFLLLHFFRLSLRQLVHLTLQDMDPVLVPSPTDILHPLGDLSRQIIKLLHGWRR